MPEEKQTEKTPKDLIVPVPKSDEFFGNLTKRVARLAIDVQIHCLSTFSR